MGGLQSMARELGVSESQAASGTEALVPAILATGLDPGLASMLDLDGDGNPLDDTLGMVGKAFR